MSQITETIKITIGITFYLLADFGGETLACGGIFTEGVPIWAALPIEWNKAGSVSCGDMAHVTLADGTTLIAPIMDFGCHLHYPVGKSLGGDGIMPYGADLPRISWLVNRKTGIGQLAVYRVARDQWWNPPTLSAYGTKWCDGPLTNRTRPRHEPY